MFDESRSGIKHSFSEKTSGLKLNNALLKRAKRELQTGRPGWEKDIDFSGRFTPRILLHGVSCQHNDLLRLESDRLNPKHELMFFGPTIDISHYGMYLEEELAEAIHEAGLSNYHDTPDNLKYLMLIFPHESTNLGRWIFDNTNPFLILSAPDFITDQDIPLSANVTIVRADMLRQLPTGTNHQIQGVNSQTELRGRLGITSQQQEELRHRLTMEIRKKLNLQ